MRRSEKLRRSQIARAGRRREAERKAGRGRKLLLVFAVLLFAAGAGLMLVPFAEEFISARKGERQIAVFREREYGNGETDAAGPEEGGSEEEGDEKSSHSELLEQMQEYNRKIYENGQQDLKDAWSYEQTVFEFTDTGLDEEMIGYITIPAMDLELPLYIGADEENLSKGAAVLGQTSMPIGGSDTNCVIAAHRGYGGAPMFREIENLEPGDRVEITNLWETLSYVVEKSIVIAPDDIEAVKILEGRDMVTLVTCHPYTENYQRYVVYCRREDGQENAESDIQEIPFSGIEYQSSVSRIRQERMLNAGGAVLFACLGAGGLIWGLAAGKNGKKKRTGAKRRH